ncbi:MAG: hypothetical protein ACPHO6_06165 [Candidatus Latescibacterota bacterium]
MAVLRSFDVFAKPIEGTRTTTATGGIITVIASLAASLLFLSQLFLLVAFSDAVKAKEEETAPSGPAKTELARKMNRLINVHAREYPQLSRTDLLDVLHRTYVKHLNPSGNDA